jgi:hypothetical protein
MSSASTTNTDSSTALVLFRNYCVRERTSAVKLFAIDGRFAPSALRSGPLPAAIAAVSGF